MNKEFCLKKDLYPNIHDMYEFLKYDNLVKLGEKYPEAVKEVIGEHKNKVLYTPEDNPSYITYRVKGEKLPEWVEPGEFDVWTVTP